MSRFRAIFPAAAKPLIAMAHVPALPGTPLYDAAAGLSGAVASVRRDVEVLLDAGFDAVMFCNENDRPYQLQAGLESAAAMTRVVTECRPEGVPFGVDFLWDARCALAVAAATGASFIREVATGVWESDMGLFSPDAAHLLRERRRLDAGDLAIFMNITPEFASGIGRRDPAEVAASTTVSSLADVILVSGKMAGAEPDVATIAASARPWIPRIPVLLNTGARAETIDGVPAVRGRLHRRQLAEGRRLHLEPGGPGAGQAVRRRGAAPGLTWPPSSSASTSARPAPRSCWPTRRPDACVAQASAPAAAQLPAPGLGARPIPRSGGGTSASWCRRCSRDGGRTPPTSPPSPPPGWCPRSSRRTRPAPRCGPPSCRTTPGPRTRYASSPPRSPGVDFDRGLTGSALTQQSVAPTLAWLAEHEPEVWARTGTVLGSYDWLAVALGAAPHVERNWALESGLYALATGPPLDPVDWLDRRGSTAPCCRRSSIPAPSSARCPPPRRPQTGLRAGTPIVAGGADHVLSAYAAGLSSPGDWLVKLGGAGDILVVTDQVLVDPRLYLDAHPRPGLWLPNGCMATSGSLIRWFQSVTGGRAGRRAGSRGAPRPSRPR